jgi:branched-chain amino acid transport system substrate-binding protein
MARNRTLVGVGALVLALSACGGGGEESDSSGDLTGEPVVIGVMSTDTGPIAYPQNTFGAEAAEWYVNNKLDGIGGRPLELHICSGDGSPETAVKCANEFVSDDVPVVFDAYDGQMGAMLPILKSAGIPIVATLASQGVVEAAEYGSGYYLSGPLETSALGMVKILSDLDIETGALAVTDAPTSHGYVDKLVKPLGDALGVDVTPVYVDGDNANFQVIAATELDTDPEVAGVISLPEDQCTGLIAALRQAGYDGKIFAGSCSQFIDEVGEDAAGSIVQPRLWVPKSYDHAPEAMQKDLDDFAEAMEEVGYEDEQSARSLYSFAGVVNLSRIITDIDGEPTPETIGTAMQAVKDFQGFAGPKITCDGQQWPGRPGACSHEGIFFEVQEDGTLKPVDAAGYIDLEPEAVTP